MPQRTPEEIISKAYKGQKNFMTPIVLEYGYIKESLDESKESIVYELSKGDGIWSRWIFGVTIVKYIRTTDEAKPFFELSQKTESVSEAREYIKKLKDEYNVSCEI